MSSNISSGFCLNMKVDQELIYSSTNLEKILKSFTPIENNIKLTLEPYPSPKVLAAFAKLAYGDCQGELDLPKDYKLLATAQNKSSTNGYFGSAFWSPTEQQIVIAHRGSENLGSFLADTKGVYFNRYTEHMSSAVSFTDYIKTVIKNTNERYGSRFVLSITGHSLGGWLASVTTMTVKYLKQYRNGFIICPGKGIHAHTVTFDSPGVKEMLDKILDDYDLRYDCTMYIKDLNITTFFVAANLVNSTGHQVGDVYQICTKRVPKVSRGPKFKTNIDTHKIDILIKALEDGKGLRKVRDWPVGRKERKRYHKQMKSSNSYTLDHQDRQNAEQGEISAGSRTQYSTKIPLLRYKTEPWLGDTCHLGVFYTEELKFLQNWSYFQCNAIFKLAEIDEFVYLQNLTKIDVPAFQINTRITCKTKEQLETLIRLTKQLMRWFPEEIMEALAKQNESIKSAPLYRAGQEYLSHLPKIMDCEDTLGIESFLESNQRVLQFKTCDGNFETARVYNILSRIRNIDLDKIYLNQNCKTVLGWNHIADTAKVVDFEGLNKNDITNNNLLIINFESTSNNLRSNDLDLLKIILNNLVLFSRKKLLIIRSHPVDAKNFSECKLPFETKVLKKFELNDLTLSSRTEIFAKDAIIIGEKTLSLAVLLGDDCYSNNEMIRNRINRIISPILRELTTDDQFRAKIQNSLLKICESDAFYSKVNTQVSKAKLTSLLERSGADEPGPSLLVVISDPEWLSRDYWGEVAEAVRERIFTSRIDGRELFLKKCCEEPDKLIYWLKLSVEGLTLSEVYNSGVYLSRMFHCCIIIKSIDKLVRYTGSQDLFVFENADDKNSFITPFNLSMEAQEHFITHIASQESSMENKMKDEKLNKHYFRNLKIEGIPRLVWQYSHGSLDGLRPFITRDYSNPIAESDFCNMRKRVTIIADDPGVGKTTSLTRMSELIRDSWVLRIDNKHSAITELPQTLDLQTVVRCLIHSSGLSINDGLTCNLLIHCMESTSSIQVYVLVDAFDEITEEESKKKVIDLLMYLKNSTTCNTIVTTRVYAQKELENYLVEFSTEIESMNEEEQDDYLVNSWLPHLALELPEHGEREKQRLHRFSRELREEMVGVLRKDGARFMGIPLQIRMLSEVFLRQAIKSVQSPKEVKIQSKIKNIFDLYTRFINVKNTIYVEQKTSIKMLPPSNRKIICKDNKENHYYLAFQTIDARFTEKYFKKQILSNEVLVDLSRVGLIQVNTDETFNFVHRTFVEYFCADFCLQWLRREEQTEESNKITKNDIIQKTPEVNRTLREHLADFLEMLERNENEKVTEIFREFLLWPCYKIIRKFINDQLEISPIQGSALEEVLLMYRHWFEFPMQILHQHDKTPLHIAAEERNRHTLAFLLSGPDNRTTEKAYIDFISAKDSAGKTALNIGLENGYLDIVNEITKNIESCSHESLLEIMLSSFLDERGDRDDDLFREYCLNTQQLANVSKALRRTNKIRKQITPFIAAVRDDDYWKVRKILNGMKRLVERKCLVTAMDAQGDSLFLLSKSKPHWKWKYILVKQGVSVVDNETQLVPWPPVAEGARSDITNYARYNIFRWQQVFETNELAQDIFEILHNFKENKCSFLISFIMWHLAILFAMSAMTTTVFFLTNFVISIVCATFKIVLFRTGNTRSPALPISPDVVHIWGWKDEFLHNLFGFIFVYFVMIYCYFLHLFVSYTFGMYFT